MALTSTHKGDVASGSESESEDLEHTVVEKMSERDSLLLAKKVSLQLYNVPGRSAVVFTGGLMKFSACTEHKGRFFCTYCLKFFSMTSSSSTNV